MKYLQGLFPRIVNRWKRARYAPDIEVTASPHLSRLGTSYGGWVFEPSSDLERTTILSCGLGEDASFDVEFAARFGARIVVVDPTPRAIAHFGDVVQRIGQPAARRYVAGGKQPADAYDLAKLTAGSLTLEPFALWTSNTKLKFFAPANPAHVSHSIVNYQNNYSSVGNHIEVETATLGDLLKKHNIAGPALIKLDIEAAEIEVIMDMLERAIYPRQILVEFDEMNEPSERSKFNAERVDRKLRHCGYACHHFDGLANFLYIRGSSRL